jgi:FkbH-like protein
MLTHDTAHLDYFRLVKEAKRLAPSSERSKVRVAVLSDASTQHLVPLLRALFARSGFDADIHAAEYDTTESEVLTPESALYAFAPDFVVLLPATNAARARFHETPNADRASFGASLAAHQAALWDALKQRSGATIVHANWVVPYEREFGHFGLKVSSSFAPCIADANARLAALARDRHHVFLLDVEGLASYAGKRTWSDEKLWTMAKSYAALDHLPAVAQGIVDVVAAQRGKAVKCVVLDLDNTLWGGVVGDDGLEGIAIGHFGEGEPFFRFQQFLRELKGRGIILAVCSKNEHETAFRAFRDHPEMVLRPGDIAAFVANWNTKVDNIKQIREALNIGFDSMVFIDDNPFERNIVREYLPEVIVPEMPEDPSDYVRALSELNLFETTSFTDEDRQRADLYREEAGRRLLEREFTNVDEYLKSLQMKVTFAAFDPFHLPRIAQLIQRSNQFNLTTRRQSLADCEALMKSGPDTLPVYVKLADKFGDYGLISVVVLRFEEKTATIDTWLMSCRVLARGVEEYTMNRVVEAARSRGLERLVGEYVPTTKNMMVKEFFARFGFTKHEEDERGKTRWVLDVDAYEPRTTFLAEAPVEGQAPRITNQP